MELVDLDHKLRQAHTNLKLPLLPITPDTLPLPPPKRKSTFLNTLSRLASPTSARVQRQTSTGQRNNISIPSTRSPTLTPSSPTIEPNDPFSSFTASNGHFGTTPTTPLTGTAPSTLSTSIAAYLTTLSNTLVLRQDRYWKRFVRVRTDDLESVRVERAIKRVRSDPAAHGGASAKENTLNGHSAEASEIGSIHEPEDQSQDERTQHLVNGDSADALALAIPDAPALNQDMDGMEAVQSIDLSKDAGEPATLDSIHDRSSSIPHDGPLTDSVPVTQDDPSPSGYTDKQEEIPPSTPDLPQSRMHRSKSADPHKFSRLPRYTSSIPSQSGTGSQTGDESSSSAAKNGQGRRGKKRSASTAAIPKEPKKSHRKVAIHDFEMMRVLGKGCAGKVLLVRHKQTSDLFALKAITKRHVLAHQELQHTLTEQAVLKRMAAESRDPFVVKLWWSFHDKENLFLVMVCFFFTLFHYLCSSLCRISIPEAILLPNWRDGVV